MFVVLGLTKPRQKAKKCTFAAKEMACHQPGTIQDKAALGCGRLWL